MICSPLWGDGNFETMPWLASGSNNAWGDGWRDWPALHSFPSQLQERGPGPGESVYLVLDMGSCVWSVLALLQQSSAS